MKTLLLIILMSLMLAEKCEDPGWLLPLQLAKKGQDEWAHPGDVGDASWKALLLIAAGSNYFVLS